MDGLQPGLYFLIRDTKKLAFIQQSMNPELTWTRVPGCPDDLPLYWLLEGDAKRLAVQVSCHQDIAGDSAFSFGMLAEFEGRLQDDGVWWYPRLFWESGLLGQVLYLEAEATRITSYNVCYTKLLRVQRRTVSLCARFPSTLPGEVRWLLLGRPKYERRVYKAWRLNNRRAGVITSYSIHYTKLYESAVRGLGSSSSGETSLSFR